MGGRGGEATSKRVTKMKGPRKSEGQRKNIFHSDGISPDHKKFTFMQIFMVLVKLCLTVDSGCCSIIGAGQAQPNHPCSAIGWHCIGPHPTSEQLKELPLVVPLSHWLPLPLPFSV